METGAPVRPNGRVGTFTTLIGVGVVAAGAFDWARAWPVPTSEPTLTTPSVLTKSRRETFFFFHRIFCVWFRLSP